MMHWLLILAGIGCALAIVDLFIHIVYGYIALRQFDSLPSFHVLPPPPDAPPMEPIQFPTTNGLTLSGGAYFPPDGEVRGVVLFCPETGGSFETVMNYAEALVESGFVVVSFSFRNELPSETLASYRSSYWVTRYEVEDIHAALDFIEAQPQFEGLPIGLMGVSRGSGAALAAGATRPEVTSVWTQGAFSNWGLSLYHALKFVRTVVGKWVRMLPIWHVKYTLWVMLRMSEFQSGAKLIDLESLLPRWKDRRVLFVSGTRDTYVPTSLPEQLCRLSGHNPDDSLWLVPQAKHNLERALMQEEFDRRVVEFFEGMTSSLKGQYKQMPQFIHESHSPSERNWESAPNTTDFSPDMDQPKIHSS